ncbi:hypothetical protein CHLNCDRAFT_142791 [Chlorella variabilis]|uniref:Uncharacterized protein n=1 Tax=Chlorella variabilis TaxID=554065 RepID=E1Z8R6_CHLVA|nr:hypothetical protein CHLNCDRAFT_142791 [Chlorella variabilis]EFN57654.1 hypothetical protein CHLNCDRAFT_142791 [Chlorella variabilis]|eukprot:XP_005849756.1 hypothetical protein CHLNCDRAFT_142791 [Chlorella variabilis]
MAAERQLLLTSFAVPPAATGEAGAATKPGTGLLLLQRGDYAGALLAALRACWEAAGNGSSSAAPESTPDWFEAAAAAFKRLLTSGPTGAQVAAAEQLLVAAVAALYLFTQANLSGPATSLPECPFDWIDEQAAAVWLQQLQDGSSPRAGASGAGFGRDSTGPGDRWAAAQLSESGEDLIGRMQYPQYLLLARMVLLAPLQVVPPGSSSGDGASSGGAAAPAAGSPATVQPAAGAAWLDAARLPCWCWWALRAVLLQQRLLSGRSAALRSLLLGLEEPVLAGLAEPVERRLALLAGGGGGGGRAPPSLEDQLLAAGALLEAALLEAAYGHMEAAARYLHRSGAVLGFRSELTGAMGVRTVHQQEARAQLLVAVRRDAGNPWTAAHAAGALPGEAEARCAIEAAAAAGVQLPADLAGFAADSDVLRHPRLVGEQEAGAGQGQGQGPALPADLHSLEQALLLGWGLHVRKGSAADGMQPWEVAAYVDAVARQKRTQFLLHAAAALQASRLEKSRSRTRDRALLQMEQLAESLDRRCAELPPAMRLRRHATLGSCLPCAAQAEELIRRRLEVTPDEPRLWCALGDLLVEDAHYLQAWERSGHRNARSQRSLARSALRAGSYAKAAAHWELALALNPLHGEGWFSLGYCHIKGKEYGRALQAFTRSSQLEPENGEAWNNLAAIHMHLKHWRQAFNALSEAVKHKRDSWQTWENYAQVAVRVRQWQTAVRALQQVLVLSSGQRADLTLVAALVGQVEVVRGVGGSGSEAADGEAELPLTSAASNGGDAAAGAERAMPADAQAAAGAAAAVDSGSGSMAELAAALGELSGGGGSAASRGGGGAGDAVQKAEARGQGVLEQSVGTLMKQVAATVSGDSRFWELYARYQAALSYADAAKECLLKRMAEADAVGVQRDLSSARLHLRGLIKQAQERYEEEPAFKELQQLLAQVEERQRGV